MAMHEHAPGRYTVQLFKGDPLGERPLRLCKRVTGLAAREQEAAFEAQAQAWASERQLIRDAWARGLVVEPRSTPAKPLDFPSYLEHQYVPWARAHLEPRTFQSRAGTLAILAEDLGGVTLPEVEHRIDELAERWRAEGGRFAVETDRLGRKLNRKLRPISDGGINERLKNLRDVL